MKVNLIQVRGVYTVCIERELCAFSTTKNSKKFVCWISNKKRRIKVNIHTERTVWHAIMCDYWRTIDDFSERENERTRSKSESQFWWVFDFNKRFCSRFQQTKEKQYLCFLFSKPIWLQDEERTSQTRHLLIGIRLTQVCKGVCHLLRIQKNHLYQPAFKAWTTIQTKKLIALRPILVTQSCIYRTFHL